MFDVTKARADSMKKSVEEGLFEEQNKSKKRRHRTLNQQNRIEITEKLFEPDKDQKHHCGN